MSFLLVAENLVFVMARFIVWNKTKENETKATFVSYECSLSTIQPN